MFEEQDNFEKLDLGTWKNLAKLILTDKKTIFLFIFFVILMGLIDVVYPLLNKFAMDTFFVDKKDQKETLFDRAMKILEQDPAFPANCEKLAQECGTSVNTLCRHFRKATGLPFKTWILNRKMENAAHLLRMGYPIKETADMIGFADRYHFSKVFKKYFGTTPARFSKDGELPLP